MNRVPTTFALLLLLAALAALAPLAARADEAAVRREFREALADARAGRTPTHEDSAALRDYVLFPYLEASRIQSLIARAPPGTADNAAERFIAGHPDLAVTRELRRQWLLDLARRQQWSSFLAHYEADGAELACDRWQARIALDNTPALKDELLAFWADAAQMPAACVPPFAWLEASGALTPTAIEQRARKALGAGNSTLANWLIAKLPAERAAPLRAWADLLDDPGEALAALAAAPQRAFEWPAVDDAFTRYARRDPDAAAALLARFDRARFTTAQEAELSRALALGYAWSRKAEALSWFQKLPAEAIDASVREWRVRSALWNRQWPLALQWAQAMPPAELDDPRWTYWRARASEKLGRKDEARTLYRKLAQDNGYYSVLAAWRLGERYTPRARKLDDVAEMQARLLQSPPLQRARELFLVDEINWANAEWRTATQDLSPADRAQAALLAARWGWHWQAVLGLTQLSATDVLDVLYPRTIYDDEIAGAARQSGLPPAWIYGVVRQESLFLPQAVSSSDALGLLQLKLGTARDVARKIGARRPDREDLFDPALNLTLGSAYLRQMTDRYDGQFVLTVAAYNAGPNAVARWLPDLPMDADVWIENVPYNETRGYVQRIAWHIAVHDWQLSGKIRDFDELLQPVRRP
ncbi:lytic transglycosylase domain-containing protein [Solimonas soli]|uniref:lytic transglycosylase domain-containing protein n=1 Tax=Solimonas soli TaxID=413479 RepID=UPI000A0545B7|nr:lytic transglycosylase domain-containing protein [Solimonas soli]